MMDRMLDAGIRKARVALITLLTPLEGRDSIEDADEALLDRYTALVALRARIEGHRLGWNDRNGKESMRLRELHAECDRLLGKEDA